MGMMTGLMCQQDSDADANKVIRMVIILNSNLRAQFLMLREFVIVLGGCASCGGGSGQIRRTHGGRVVIRTSL